MAEGFSNAKENSSREKHQLCTIDLGWLMPPLRFSGAKVPQHVVVKEKCSICIYSLEFEVFGGNSPLSHTIQIYIRHELCLAHLEPLLLGAFSQSASQSLQQVCGESEHRDVL